MTDSTAHIPTPHIWAGTVIGMTCGHCVASVTEELSELSGVDAVDVVLDTGRVTVHGTEPLNPADIAAAITEAGYTLA
ncbi:MAG: heavy-metal-associated domain-containing protein [Nocardioides sp.]